jgi:two-component sensor histidine kinase
MLIDELNHRVKNTLATVQSIVWQALRKTTNTEAVREAIESRLFALSRSHDLLTRENWESAGVVNVIKDALEPFSAADAWADRIEITGEDIRFPPQAALTLSIVFNELATNAVKYGAFSNGTGSILIGWKIEPDSQGSQIMLPWQEKDGPLVPPPRHEGFGSRVIEHGLDALNATVKLDYLPTGLHCTMRIPVPQGARNE